MQADRFTIKAQEALAGAGRLAEGRRNPQVMPLHLLDALLAEPAAGASSGSDAAGGLVLGVLAKLGVQTGALRDQSSRRSSACPSSPRAHRPPPPRARS